jgi:hypothetical protein
MIVIFTVSLSFFLQFFFSFCRQDGHDSEDTKQSTADMTAFVSILVLFVWYFCDFETISLGLSLNP